MEVEPPESQELRSMDGSSPSSSRRTKRRHQGHKPKRSVRDSLSDSFRELKDVDEEHFYEHLLALKNEHKKTLKTLEKLYYSEKDKLQSGHGFDLDSRTRISVDDLDESRIHGKVSSDVYDPFHETVTDRKGNFEMSVRPQDHIRDMSVRDETTAVDHEENEDYSSLEELQVSRRRSSSDPTEGDHRRDDEMTATRKCSEDGTSFYTEMFPQRSSALDIVEDMWEGFSVYDYPADPSPPREKREDKKNWALKLTIPKPFSMTMREAKKTPKNLTRSQRILLEDLKRRQENEEAELHKKFRAQPVPATTFLPLYDEITRQNELRRYRVRELSKAILKSSERPFKFMKREEEKKKLRRTKSLSNLSELEGKLDDKKKFKANPFPDHLFDLSLADRMAEKEEYRAIRVRMRAQETLAMSRLPPNMESRGKDYTLGTFRSKLSKDGNKNAFMTKEHKFRPQVNTVIPEFDALHRQFEKEMRNKKKEREPTVVEPFALKTEQVSGARKSRATRSQEIQDSMGSSRERSASRERPSSARSYTPRDTLPFGTTESSRLRESSVRKSLQQRIDSERDEVKQGKRRRRRQKLLKPEVTRKVMANDNSAQLKNAAKKKVQSFRESDRARREEYNRELQEMEKRVSKRPLLFEQQSQATARRAAERKYADILRSAGVDEAIVQNLVTKDGRIVDAESEDDLEETGSQADYSGSEQSSGIDNRPGSRAGNINHDESDVQEDTDEDDVEI